MHEVLTTVLALVCSHIFLLAARPEVVLPQPPALALDHTCWEDAEDHLAAARADRDQGDLSGALLEYREALEHEPDSLAAVRGVAEIAGGSGHVDLAGAALSLWMELDPADPDPALRLSRLRLDAGEDEAALRMADEAARRDPRSGDAHFLQGKVLFRAGDLPSAVTALEEAVSLDPQHGRAFELLGMSYLRLGRPGEAVASLKAAALLLPEVPGVQENLGRACLGLGLRADAAAAFREAARLHPKEHAASARPAKIRRAQSSREARLSPAVTGR